MGVHSIECDAIEIQQGVLERKRIESSHLVVSIDGNEIFVASGRWKIKAKEIQHINIAENENNKICIESKKDSGSTIYYFTPMHRQSHDAKKKWDAFIGRLIKLYNKCNSLEVQGFTEFLHKSSKHQLGGESNNSRSSSATRHPNKLPQLSSHRPVLTSWDNQHKATAVVSQSHRPQRGVFGSKKVIPSIEPLYDREIWGGDQHSTPASLLVPPNVISRDSTKKKRRLLPPRDEQFSSDEEEPEALGNREEEAETGHDLPEASLEMDEPSPVEEQKTEEEKEWKKHDCDISDGDKVRSDTKAQPRRRLTKMKNRSSKNEDKAEESSDDEIFGRVEVTTPFVQRLVSPHVSNKTTTLPHRSTPSQKRVKKSLLDEMDDSSEEETVIDKRQPSVAAFFQPQNRTKSIATGTVPTTMPEVKTPTRRTKHNERNARTLHTSTIHHVTSSAVKMKQKDNIDWLLQSPSRKLRSPQESRRLELFGHDPSTSSANRSMSDKQHVLVDDPIQDYTSPPRLQTKLGFHRSSVDERTAYRPLDYSMPSKRIVPSLANRFANSASTPAALVQYVSKTNIANATHDSDIVSSNTMSYYRKFRGLRNLGNTCYQNSSLQMLYSCRNLMTSLRHHMDRWEHDRNKGTLTNSICTIGQELFRKYMPPVNSQMIKDAMDTKTDKYIGYEQRDAHEFISDLIDFVHDELQVNNISTAGSDEILDDMVLVKKAVPTDDFCMSVQVCLKCCSCGYTRNKEEMYRHLSIDIISDDEVSNLDSNDNEVTTVSIATVQKSLEHFFQPEVREIKCEKCVDGTHAEQTLQIISQPKLLLLHLKRFIVIERKIYPKITEIDTENHPPNASGTSALLPATPTTEAPPQIEYVFKKNKAPMDIPMSLSLETFYQTSTPPPTSQSLTGQSKECNKYALKSIVHHLGATASSGHYTADAIREVNEEAQDESYTGETTKSVVNNNLEGIWVSFDDGNTNETTIDKILSNRFKQSTAYMLLYASEET